MMRELEIERQFDLKIEKMQPNKGVYYLNTNKGRKCLKRINYGVQKLSFVYGAKEHLINNGFTFIDKNLLNVEGNPYALVNEDIYTLSDWIEGRECDFYNDEDLVIAAKALAKLHSASKGYEPEENSKLKSDLGRWPHLMEKRVDSFNKMRNMVKKKKNKKTEFDFSYINNMEYFKEYGMRAIKVLESSEYLELCKVAEEEKSFCHHDFTYHNIIISEDNTVNVVDFDYCKRELRVYDIANFLTKVLKRREWDIHYANIILEAYNSINPLREEEYRVLFAFLLFPQRFWRLCNRYYYNETGWIQNTFNNKIESIIKEKDIYNRFIEAFKEKI